MNLPMATLPMAPRRARRGALAERDRASCRREVRALARGARRGDPRPQLPGARGPGRRRLRRRLARRSRARPRAAEGEVIVFCGVHFMAETASILCPEKTVLIPDLDAGCSLADSIDAEQLRRLEGASIPERRGRDVREHDRRGQGADRLLLHLGQRGRRRAPHLRDPRARTPRSCSARTCGSAPTSRRSWAGACTSGTASATSTPASARRTSRPPAPRTPAPTS